MQIRKLKKTQVKSVLDVKVKERLGVFLQSLRIDMGITQREAATRIGITYPYLSQLERGERMPSREVIANIARTYAIDEQLLLRESGTLGQQSSDVSHERINWAFETVCRDCDFRYGVRIRHKPFDLETKALIVEIYEAASGRNLLLAEEKTGAAELTQIPVDLSSALSRQIRDDFTVMMKSSRRTARDVQVPDVLDCIAKWWEQGVWKGGNAVKLPTPAIEPDVVLESPEASIANTPNPLPVRRIRVPGKKTKS